MSQKFNGSPFYSMLTRATSESPIGACDLRPDARDRRAVRILKGEGRRGRPSTGRTKHRWEQKCSSLGVVRSADMSRLREILGATLLGGTVAAWIAATSTVAAAPDQHWSSPIILGLLAGGGACLIGGVALLAGARPRLLWRQPDATIIGVGLPEKPCIAYPLAENGQHVGDGCFCHLEVRSLSSEATLRTCRARLIKV